MVIDATSIIILLRTSLFPLKPSNTSILVCVLIIILFYCHLYIYNVTTQARHVDFGGMQSSVDYKNTNVIPFVHTLVIRGCIMSLFPLVFYLQEI